MALKQEENLSDAITLLVFPQQSIYEKFKNSSSIKSAVTGTEQEVRSDQSQTSMSELAFTDGESHALDSFIIDRSLDTDMYDTSGSSKSDESDNTIKGTNDQSYNVFCQTQPQFGDNYGMTYTTYSHGSLNFDMWDAEGDLASSAELALKSCISGFKIVNSSTLKGLSDDMICANDPYFKHLMANRGDIKEIIATTKEGL